MHDVRLFPFAGLYCKWLIRSAGEAQMTSLLMTFLSSYVTMTSRDCDYDGFVIYDGNSTSAARIGSETKYILFWGWHCLGSLWMGDTSNFSFRIWWYWVSVDFFL